MNEQLAPHRRTENRTGHMTLDVLVAAAVLCTFSAVNYGMRPVILVLLSCAAAFFCEFFTCLLRRKSLRQLLDGSAIITGAIIGMVMSPATSYWVPMLGSAFAILVVKAPFGGTGRNVFNPAAAGLAVLSYCFPTRVFTYPALSTVHLPLSMNVPSEQLVTERSLASQLRDGATPAISRLQLLLGDFVGPIGATATLILLACAVYLLCRRTASGWLVLPYLITCLLLAWLFPCAGVSRVYGTIAQMCSGYVLFTGVFLLNDPVTTPRFWLGRLLYGISTAALVMLLQHTGRVETGCCFAILMMNTLAPILDRWSWYLWRKVSQIFRVRREVKAHE